jgi:hypothetical protein
MNIRAKIFGGNSPVDEPLLRAKTPKGAKADELHSIAVPRETRRRSNSRAGDRHRLSGERARISHEGREIEVELLNLSGGGAMVTGPFEPLLWDRVDLTLGQDGTIECAVRWIREGRVGLEFAHETRLDCGPDQVASVLREVIARSFPELEFGEAADDELAAEPEGSVATAKSSDDHRAALRHPLIWTGQLHHDYQSTKIRIRNISATGAMIESPDPVRVGAEPMLELAEELMVPATVMWIVGDQVGLRFHSPFDIDLLAGTRPTVAPASWSPPKYLDSDVLDTSPWDPRWNRGGLKELQRELEGFLKR